MPYRHEPIVTLATFETEFEASLARGALEAIGIRYQAITIPGVGVVPVQFMQALPYILTVVILAGFVGKAIPPKAGGRPYVKER